MIFYHSRSGSVERSTSLACKFCLPISGLSRDFPFFITFKLCIHRKDFTKILSQPKMGKQAEGGSLTRAWSVFFSPV